MKIILYWGEERSYYGKEKRGIVVRFPVRARIFLLFKTSKPAMWPTDV